MKKRFAIILTAAALSMTGCSLLGQDTYYIDQGMEQINSGNYEEALTSFSSAEQEGKHLVESYRGSGMAYMALGEYDKAVEAFDRAVDLTKEAERCEERYSDVQGNGTVSVRRLRGGSQSLRYDPDFRGQCRCLLSSGTVLYGAG